MPSSTSEITFGTSGIRGPVGERITPELALALGRATGAIADRIVVGRDARTTGPMLERAFVAGALTQGADVVQAGVVPTPTIGYAAREHDVGVVITASHNPPPDNGFKFWAPDGSALGDKPRERLLAALQDPPAPASWDTVGQASQDEQLVRRHVDAILSHAGHLDEPVRVVVDPGNGAASELAPALLSQAGASVMTLNANADGTFPARPSEPTAENLADLRHAVEATDAVLGIAHDGDGDRVALVDETGRLVPGDLVIVLLARALGVDTVAVPVDTSRVVWDALEGVEVLVTPVGDPYVSAALAELGDGRGFGGEASGSMILPSLSLCPDGPHAALLLARIASETQSLAALVDALPTYETERANVACPEAHKATAMAQVGSTLADALEADGEVSTLDGVRLDTEDGWVLVRPSGTEPKIRITAEAREPSRASELLTQARETVDRAIDQAGSAGRAEVA